MNLLITGVAKGIGLALTVEALKKNYQVCGVARNPEASKDLMELQNKYPSLKLIKLDLTDPTATEKLSEGTRGFDHFDVVINNAGIYEKGSTKEAFLKSFEVNSYVPFLVTETLLPKLKKAGAPKLVQITSMMGSIADNSSGGSYAYRASKTALNMINKSIAVENPWLATLVIHPGWVQTAMGGESAPTPTATSAQGIWRVIDQLTPEQSGVFKDFQGRELPW